MGKHIRPDEYSEPQVRERAPVFKRVAIVAGIVVAGVIATLAGMSVAQHKPVWQIVATALTPSPQQVFGKNNILVLIEGLDYDYTSKDEEYSSQARSDVIWAVNLDFITHRIYQLAVPRDMVATYPGGRQQKINQAQSEGGVREAQSVISQFLGIPGFDRYMVFRAESTEDFVNSLGGIDVKVVNSDCLMHPHNCINGPLDYDDSWGHLHIHLKPGLQHLNGVQAVGYMRFRHDWCGDPCRIMRQQVVLHALLHRLTADKVNTLLHMNDLLGAINRDVQTNLSRQEEISIATAFADMSPHALITKQVPYVADVTLPDGGAAIVPDETARAKLVRTMLIAPPQPTAPPDPGALAAVAPGSLRVDIENGTGVPGLAKRVAALLRSEGFKIAQVGNAASGNVATTEVHEHSRVAMAGLKVRNGLGSRASRVPVISEAVSSQTPSPSDVTVIIGDDLVTAMSSPSASQ
ncbi:MAG TPA: LCP family protein [Candidatus Rubrimentiphilum sp.]|nr:LCP family protein [Candidatus Rubrimentiphilum sp.]